MKLPINEPNNRTKASDGGNPSLAKEILMTLIKRMPKKSGSSSKRRKNKGFKGV